MVWLLLIWLALFVILLGAGLLMEHTLRRFAGPDFGRPLNVFQLFWSGYALTIGFLQINSLFLPTKWHTLTAVMVLAASGFVLQRGRTFSWFHRPASWPRFAGALSVVVITALVVAIYASMSVGWYDSHLYHLQVVQWARKFAAVPGVANLHFRLGYNNSVHLYAALTDVFWRGRAAYIALGLLVTVTLLQLFSYGVRQGSLRIRTTAAFALMIVPFVLGRFLGEVNSLSTDLPLALLSIVMVAELFNLSLEQREGVGAQLSLLVMLGCVSVTTKMGGLGMLTTVGLLALVLLLRKRLTGRSFVVLAVPSAIILVGYFARQAVLSGWLFFPVAAGNLHLPWSVTPEEALDQYRWIQSWARLPAMLPAEVLDHGFMHWFRPWYEGRRGTSELLLLKLAAALWLWQLLKPTPKPVASGWAALAALLSLVIWFRGAPDLRFGAVFFWLAFASAAAPLLGRAMEEPTGQVVALSVSLFLGKWTSDYTLMLPQPEAWTSLPKVAPLEQLKTVELGPGLLVKTPTRQGADQCSDVPLPCTPVVRPLLLREPGNLGAGFKPVANQAQP